ncbi:MAG: MBL fold metallo-hydrolase [Bdellovibrionaceae bacterium]|nr:MBL fold metallo-hydrolase [Pseudobdellovibrionaceae bacterium]
METGRRLDGWGRSGINPLASRRVFSHSLPVLISRILHAGYVFDCAGTRIAFDPIFENPFSRNCHAFPDVRFDHARIRELKWDAVFISHFHDDHCSFESLNLLDRATPIHMFCPREEMFDLLRALGFHQVHSLELNQKIRIGPFEITPRRALDEDVDSIFQIKAAGLNILNVVDSWIDDDTMGLLVREGPWDLVLWPFQTMREIEVLSPSRFEAAPRGMPPEWIEQLRVLQPRFLVPSSCQFRMEDWSWYNKAFFPISYRRFQDETSAILPKTEVLRMNPSTSWIFSGKGRSPAAPLAWMEPVGEQDVDYDYDPGAKPLSTAEIARFLPASGARQARRVQDYCRTEIIEKHLSLELSEESYFQKPRFWRLSLFDHTGDVQHHWYGIEGNIMRSVAAPETPPDWTTEVPLVKLHAALEDGESLTSMYVRINGGVFSPETERELRNSDLLEDPLIRCLFSGSFASYQKAQLAKLTRVP